MSENKRKRKPRPKKASAYSAATLFQIQGKLLDYLVETNEKWYNYHNTIHDLLGLKGEDRILHDHDPGNWLKLDIEPEADRLEIYSNFISKVYPDFVFSDNYHQNYLSIGMMLAKFSIGQVSATERKFLNKTQLLDRKLLVSRFKANDSLAGGLFDARVLCFKKIPKTPFLICFKFTTTMSFNADYLNTGYEKEPPRVTNEKFPIRNLERGILCPLIKEHSYHGILKTPDYVPAHVKIDLINADDDWAFGLEYRSLQGTEQFSEDFVRPKTKYKQLDKIFAELGEPVL